MSAFALSFQAMAALNVLHAFSAGSSAPGLPVPTNSDGIAPSAALVFDGSGNLYGTAAHGGANGAGSIFRLSPGGGFTELYSFAPATNAVGAVNYNLSPNALVLGNDGSFRGTTARGGPNFTGSIFTVSPSGDFSTVYTFGPQPTNSSLAGVNATGAMPVGALVLAGDGNFYGATQYGGSNNTGTIFRWTANGAFSALHSFAKSDVGSTNGAVPNALVLGNDGALYGTTQQGGVLNAGTFFKFSLAGGFVQLASFNGSQPNKNPVTPDSPLVSDAGGNFYGASSGGGSQGGGSIFAINPSGAVSLVYSFPLADAGAIDTVTRVNSVFYGTISANGLNGNGAVYHLVPTNQFGAYYFSLLNTNGQNSDGANPLAGLTADGSGSIYGACAAGGANGSGVIFQISAANFIPPYFIPQTNPPPALANTLVGSSISLSYVAQGLAPLTFQWTRNGTNLTDGGDISGSGGENLVINPVSTRDVGSYALVVGNSIGAITSAVTVLTVKPPGVSISSPTPNERTAAPVFSGFASNAPVAAGANASGVILTSVTYSISNLFNGSNISGLATLTSGSGSVSNWSFSATPLPGTNFLAVQSMDASGNVSPVATVTFFEESTAPLTVQTAGSGTASFSLANGQPLNIGQSYKISVKPVDSVFEYWIVDGATNFFPTLSFVMTPNLVLTADLLARQGPEVSITFPKPGARVQTNFFTGAAKPSPMLPGVDPTNTTLVGVTYWLTNTADQSVQSGQAALTAGDVSSNWSVTITPQPATNFLAVQSHDVSGGKSRIVSREFFYEVPTPLMVVTNGNGSGALSLTNLTILNIGQTYRITARPGPYSTFAGWRTSSGIVSTQSTLSFVMQPGLVLTATFSLVPPRVTITSPRANLRTASPPEFDGTAFGQVAITNVVCTLEDDFVGAVTNASATLTASDHTATWSAAISPWPGTNTLRVYAVDANGAQSAVVSREFFFEVAAPLTVSSSGPGNGTFKGRASIPGNPAPANGAMLFLGEGYSITAIPDKFSLFSNWVSSVGSSATISDSPTLSFVMESNLVLTASFVSNLFPSAAGQYNGLFFPDSGPTVESSGMIQNLALLSNGGFSGRLLTSRTNAHFSGKFDVTGQAAFSLAGLQFSLALDTSIPIITGAVIGAGFISPLTAEFATNSLSPAEYTLLFPPSSSFASTFPPGVGYALVSAHAGTVTLSGALADGTAWRQSVPASISGDIPIYQSLYGPSRGLLLGWINVTNLEGAEIPSGLAWIKKSAPSPRIYTNGFTNFLAVEGSVWAQPPSALPDIPLAGADLVFSNSALLLDYTNVSVRGAAITDSGPLPTNSLSGTVNPKTGLVTLSFGNGKGRSTTRAVGAFLLNATNAGGFFLTTTNAGAFSLQP